MARRAIIVIVVSLLVIFGYYWLVNRWYPPRPPAPPSNPLAGATNFMPGGTNSTLDLLAPGVLESAVPAAAIVGSDAPEELVVAENDNARYTFTSRGGALKLVELKKYPESVSCQLRNGVSTNRLATLNARAPAPAFAWL